MSLIDLANPTRFLALTERVLPWLATATAVLLTIGLYQSAMAPDDYQQGATVKIMFIHVPNAWLSMFVWGVMSVAALARWCGGIRWPMWPPKPPLPSARRLHFSRLSPARCGAVRCGAPTGSGMHGSPRS